MPFVLGDLSCLFASADVGVADQGHARTRARARAARAALAAQQASVGADLFGSAAEGTRAGGIQRARPAANTMAVAPMQGLDQLLAAYTQFMALKANDKPDFLNGRKSFKPNTGPTPFMLGPGTLDSFAAVYDVVLKLADLLAAGRFYGTQEDLGVSCMLSAFAVALSVPKAGTRAGETYRVYIEAQARLAQQDAKAAAAVVPSEASSFAQLAATCTPWAPLITGGDQPEGYLYVGLNHGLSVWGHADVVAASVELDGDEGPPGKNTKSGQIDIYFVGSCG